jgi:hypothetical protein
MRPAIRVHLTIDTIRVAGANLAHRHALAPAIESRLKAMLQDTGVDFRKPHRFSMAAVRSEPLSYRGHIRPVPLAEGIARQVARSIARVQGRHEANADGKGDA